MAGKNVPIQGLRSYHFPLRRGPRGYFEMANDADCIKQNVMQIIGTPIGARVMRPTFGCEIWTIPFEPDDEETQAVAEASIKKALALWEPRVEVIEVTTREEPTNGSLSLRHYVVRYRIIATGQIDEANGALPQVK